MYSPFPIQAVESGPNGLQLLGELDLDGVPEVAAILAGFDGDISVDCSRLTFVDAAGLGMFVAAHKRCEDRGVKLVLVNPLPFVRRLLTITALDSVLNVDLDRRRS